MVQYVYHRSNLRGTAECAVFVNGRCDLTICNDFEALYIKTKQSPGSPGHKTKQKGYGCFTK